MIQHFKKAFGQNFLRSEKYAKKLIDSINPDKNDIIVEIGPGEGFVTSLLIERVKHVFAIEIDTRFIYELKRKFKERNFTVYNEDILTYNFDRLPIEKGSYKVIGSLPYNISKKIIKNVFEYERRPELFSFIIQKEVAQDYTAEHPRSTFLSNFAKIYSSARYISTVPKERFFPRPKVDGAIVKFILKEKIQRNHKKFARFLKASFANPRKKLINNLVSLGDKRKNELKKRFVDIGIKENARASDISFENWLVLHEFIRK